jgi:hypothetical protein
MTDPERHRGNETTGRLIRSLALVVAGVVVVLGVAAAVIPDIVIATGRYLVSPSGLYAAAAFRAGVGLVLILAARESRAPGLLRAIGVVVLVGAVATPFFGVEAARARLDWEAAHVTFFRVEGVAFVCLGGLIVSALRPGGPITAPAIADVDRQ